ncbi:unnamed protein product [Echinostoma caproni]|uniref:Uncharacterized protein n=1 Tax=Echinostoma caproni TaxID=27848 RepID=A0A183ATP5_9TREM|nr:unnamed protein product [Echinostoma caproni]
MGLEKQPLELVRLRRQLAGAAESLLLDPNQGIRVPSQSDTSSLTERLSNAERELALEKQKTTTLDAELRDLKTSTDQSQSLAAQQLEACLRKQLDNFSDLTGQELARIRAFHDEIQIKEFDLLREQRDKAVDECDTLRTELASMRDLLQSTKAELNALRNTNGFPWGGSHPESNRVEDLTLHTQLTKMTIELEAARAARNDALLQSEKLAAQLDASKQAFYELRTRSRLDYADLESKLTMVQEKLRGYEQMEQGIDEVIEHVPTSDHSQDHSHTVLSQLGHFCVESCRGPSSGSVFLPTLAARRLEHAVKLAKQVTQLKAECARLVAERDASNQEAKLEGSSKDWFFRDSEPKRDPTNESFNSVSPCPRVPVCSRRGKYSINSGPMSPRRMRRIQMISPRTRR